jgi:hypothetical protein
MRGMRSRSRPQRRRRIIAHKHETGGVLTSVVRCVVGEKGRVQPRHVRTHGLSNYSTWRRTISHDALQNINSFPSS